jgi:hypothetical protein
MGPPYRPFQPKPPAELKPTGALAGLLGAPTVECSLVNTDHLSETRNLVDDTTTNNVPTEMLQMLGQLLTGPVAESGASDGSYYALMRTARRLGALRNELQSTGEDALDAAKAAYGSILASVMRHLDETGKEEIERLGMSDTEIASFIEIRIALAQLHGWLENVVSGLETRREAEQMLGGTLEKIMQDATLVAETPQIEPRTVGMYL